MIFEHFALNVPDPQAMAQWYVAHCGMRVLALSVVTNVAHPDLPDRVSAQQVLSDASRAAPHVREIVRAALAV